MLCLGDENLLFRGNSFATKAMDYYMKMVGEEVGLMFPLFRRMWNCIIEVSPTILTQYFNFVFYFQYLEQTLGGFVKSVYEFGDICEVRNVELR